MSDAAKPMALVAQLVVKQGVSLGCMGDDERRAALSLAWAGLPTEVMSEAGVNQALKAALSGAAACLATDHVELRRWLVDAGWLARDGFGRAYRRLPVDEVFIDNQPWAALWSSVDAATWVAAQRQQHAALRAQRRQRWEGGAQAA